MMDLWYRMLQRWVARRRGRADGLHVIPDSSTTEPPSFLQGLARWGEGRLGRWAVYWQHRDEELALAYRLAAVRYAQGCDALEQAREEETQAHDRWRQRPALPLKREWQRRRRVRLRAQRREQRARQRLEAVISRRRGRFEQVAARCLLVVAEVGRLQQIYTEANLRSREAGELPPVLRQEMLPVARMPQCLQELVWDPPMVVARSGATRAGLPVPAPPGPGVPG